MLEIANAQIWIRSEFWISCIVKSSGGREEVTSEVGGELVGVTEVGGVTGV